jgi:uncharacterized protein YciI
MCQSIFRLSGIRLAVRKCFPQDVAAKAAKTPDQEALMDFLVVMRMRDPKDPDLQRKRAELRDEHLARASGFRERGHLVLGGAIFDDEGNLAGSAAIARFDTRAALDAWLADDPWTKAGVYTDFEITPFKIAPHYLEGH